MYVGVVASLTLKASAKHLSSSLGDTASLCGGMTRVRCLLSVPDILMLSLLNSNPHHRLSLVTQTLLSEPGTP